MQEKCLALEKVYIYTSFPSSKTLNFFFLSLNTARLVLYQRILFWLPGVCTLMFKGCEWGWVLWAGPLESWWSYPFLWGQGPPQITPLLGSSFLSLPSPSRDAQDLQPREPTSWGNIRPVQILPWLWSKMAGGTVREMTEMNYVNKSAESSKIKSSLDHNSSAKDQYIIHQFDSQAFVKSTAYWSRVPMVPPPPRVFCWGGRQ